MVGKWFSFLKDYCHFKRLDDRSRFKGKIFPCLNDATLKTSFDRHYVYHTALAARQLKTLMPQKHVDIGSYLYFSTIVSAFIPVDFYDFRPALINLSQLNAQHADITHLPFLDHSIPSLSCMHVIEHVGLGRYGDPLDPNGDLKAMAELKRVVSFGGSLFFVVPIADQATLYFNAHRVYTLKQILNYFEGWQVVDVLLIPDQGEVQHIDKDSLLLPRSPMKYACACFWFKKQGGP